MKDLEDKIINPIIGSSMADYKIAEALNGTCVDTCYTSLDYVNAYKSQVIIASIRHEKSIVFMGLINIEIQCYDFDNRGEFKLYFDEKLNYKIDKANNSFIVYLSTKKQETEEEEQFPFYITAKENDKGTVLFDSNVPHYRYMHENDECLGIVFSRLKFDKS